MIIRRFFARKTNTHATGGLIRIQSPFPRIPAAEPLRGNGLLDIPDGDLRRPTAARGPFSGNNDGVPIRVPIPGFQILPKELEKIPQRKRM